METNNQDNKYYNEYLKYKTKYLNLKGGERHDCKPENKYSEICIPNIKGQYKSKESCVNDCENKYINHQLIRANIKGETVKFYLFIKDIIQNEKIDVYVKGGNVIGLYVLKMIYNKYKNNDRAFKDAFDEFLKLELIKDWDFASYTKNKISQEYRDKLDSIAHKYKLVPRAKTFILYQTKHPILTDDKALFEISVLDSDAYSKLEIPMTTMKVKVTEYNLKYIYMFAKSFLSYKLTGEEFDFDILKKMINKINVITHPHKEGLYDPGSLFDKGCLNNELINFINDYSKKDKKIAQFLVIHIEDPFRLLFRLPEKNIPKTEKIKEFIRKELKESNMPSWLMDTDKISKLVESFAKSLGQKIGNVYADNFKKTNSVTESMNKVVEFMKGVTFNRTQLEYDTFTDKNKEILKLIFKPLIGEVSIEEFKGMDETDNLIKFIKFLIGKQLF